MPLSSQSFLIFLFVLMVGSQYPPSHRTTLILETLMRSANSFCDRISFSRSLKMALLYFIATIIKQRMQKSNTLKKASSHFLRLSCPSCQSRPSVVRAGSPSSDGTVDEDIGGQDGRRDVGGRTEKRSNSHFPVCPCHSITTRFLLSSQLRSLYKRKNLCQILFHSLIRHSLSH